MTMARQKLNGAYRGAFHGLPGEKNLRYVKAVPLRSGRNDAFTLAVRFSPASRAAAAGLVITLSTHQRGIPDIIADSHAVPASVAVRRSVGNT